MNAPHALKFKIARHVTVPLLKVPDNGTPVYVKITGEIFTAKETGEGRNRGSATPAVPGQEPKAKVQPPKLAHVVNLETGQVQQIIVGAILESELNDTYPNASYLNKSFEIKKHAPTGGKRYAMYAITEIELETDEPAEKPATNGKKGGKAA